MNRFINQVLESLPNGAKIDTLDLEAMAFDLAVFGECASKVVNGNVKYVPIQDADQRERLAVLAEVVGE